MEANNVTQAQAMTGDGGRGAANIAYICYIIGFFTGFTALVGVIIAYVNRNEGSAAIRSHFNFQIKIFWLGVLAMIVIVFAWMIVSFAAFRGAGFVLFVVPLALGAWWFVWTILAIVRGMSALGRGQAVSA